MTDPTPLSPAAQAVLDAYANRAKRDLQARWVEPAIAAALRAAAFQLSFGHATGDGILCEDDLFAIAAELDNHQPTIAPDYDHD